MLDSYYPVIADHLEGKYSISLNSSIAAIVSVMHAGSSEDKLDILPKPKHFRNFFHLHLI